MAPAQETVNETVLAMFSGIVQASLVVPPGSHDNKPVEDGDPRSDEVAVDVELSDDGTMDEVLTEVSFVSDEEGPAEVPVSVLPEHMYTVDRKRMPAVFNESPQPRDGPPPNSTYAPGTSHFCPTSRTCMSRGPRRRSHTWHRSRTQQHHAILNLKRVLPALWQVAFGRDAWLQTCNVWTHK
ncbi:hypothetical protein B0H10DRAFT_2234037 [Mycena sp. CBHHK59/15]|nr:hypothetical protein B0H10DRAFT_2234037 [Mycena sp. CBHHK59/15]